MRRWRRDIEEEDEILTFDEPEDEVEEENDEEKENKTRRRSYSPPRRIHTRFEYEEESADEDGGPTFEELEGKIRSGKYKPKAEDPWHAHVLYQTLKDLGDI